jgi:ABC-type molybdate transport system substrate-binding protein
MKLKVIAFIAVMLCVIIASCQSEAEQEFKRITTAAVRSYKQNARTAIVKKAKVYQTLSPRLPILLILKKQSPAGLFCKVRY